MSENRYHVATSMMAPYHFILEQGTKRLVYIDKYDAGLTRARVACTEFNASDDEIPTYGTPRLAACNEAFIVISVEDVMTWVRTVLYVPTQTWFCPEHEAGSCWHIDAAAGWFNAGEGETAVAEKLIDRRALSA